MFQLTAAEWENLKSQIVIQVGERFPWWNSGKILYGNAFGPELQASDIIPASRADSLSTNQLSRSRT
jgi:hypothetical protein